MIFVVDEERIDEIGRRDDILTDHGAYAGRLSIPTRPRSLLYPHSTMIVARYRWRVTRCRIECFVAEVVVDSVHRGVDGVSVSCTEDFGGRRI